MLNELGQDLVAYFQGLKSDGFLPRIKTIKHDDTAPRTEELNALTVDWDDKLSFTDTGNHIQLSPVFAVTLYTTSISGERDADLKHQLAMIEAQPGNKFRGLIPACIRIRRGYTQANGQAWTVSYAVEPRVAFKQGRDITTIQTINLTFTSLFSPSQFT